MAGNRPTAIVWNRTAPSLLRGFLKKLLFICSALFLIFQARTSQLAFIVLNEATLAPGRVPSNWQVKVNHGKPEFGACTESDVACLHLKSVKSSFALQRDVD